MSINCHLEYLDKNGQKSADYYNNLHLGHDKALEIYLNKNKAFVSTKFQHKQYSFSDILEASNNISDPIEESNGKRKYVYQPGTSSYDIYNSATGLVELVKNPFLEDEAAKDYVIVRKASDLLAAAKLEDAITLGYDKAEFEAYKSKYNDFNKYAAITKPEAKKHYLEAAKIYYNQSENKKEFTENFESIKSKWKTLTEIGNETHNLAENFFKIYRNSDESKSIEAIIDEAVQNTPLEFIPNANDAAQYLRSVYKLIFEDNNKFPTLYKNRNVKVYPEFKIISSDYKIAGRIDLLIVDEKNNAFIFDIKTKEPGKEPLFNFEKDKMLAPLDNLYANKQNEANLQTSIYHRMLTSWGDKIFNSIKSYVLYTEGTVSIEDKRMSYNQPKATSLISLEYKRKEVTKLLHSLNLSDGDKIEVEPGKLNDPNQILEHFFDINVDDMFTGARLENKILNELDRPQIDENGKEYFFSSLPEDEGGKRYYKSRDNNERAQQLREYFKEVSVNSTRVADNFIFYANNRTKQSNFKSNDEIIQVNKILKAFAGDTYHFTKLNAITGYEDFNHNLILAKNVVTGEGSIINLNAYLESDFLEREEKRNHKNIFGKFITDIAFKNLAGPGIESLPYTKASVQLLRGGMIALDLKKRGYISSIGQVRVGVINRILPKASLISTNIHKLAPHLGIVNKIIDDSNEHSQRTKDLFGELKTKSKLTLDAFSMFNEYIDSELMIYLSKNKKYYSSLQDSLVDFSINPVASRNHLLKDLQNAHNYLSKVLSKKYNNIKEEVILNPEFQLISQMIAQLNGAHILAGDLKDKLEFDVKARIQSNINDEAISALDRVVKESNLQINNTLVNWEAKKLKIMSDLAAEKNKGRFASVIENDLDLFDDLWIINPKDITDEIREQRPNDLFKLKDPEDPSLAGKPAAQAFIRFFQETILRSLELSLTKEEYENVISQKTWKDYLVPLMPASMINKISSEGDVKTKFKLILKSFSKVSKPLTKEDEMINDLMENDFLKQVDAGKVQTGPTRRKLLGINAEGTVIDNMQAIETNLESVMQNFFLKSAACIEHNKTMSFFNALNAIAFMEEYANFNNTEQVREAMKILIALRVKNEVKKEGKVGKIIDQNQKALTTLAFAGSIKQITLEAATNSIASLSTIITQTAMGLIDKKSQKIGAANWVKASMYVIGRGGSVVMNSKYAQITHLLSKKAGLYNADPLSWSKKDKMVTRKNGWFQSKWLFFLNNLPFKFFKTIYVFAEIDKLSGLDLLDLNEDEQLIYKYTEDPRFSGIFNSDGSVKQKLPLELDLLKRKALYEYYLKEWEKDNTLDSEGKPTIPVTHKEIMGMQDRSLSIYGSMDNDAALLFQHVFMGRMFLKFKSWFAAKKDNYWTESKISKVRGAVTWNEELLEYDFEYEHVEGIVQTFAHMYKVTRNMTREIIKGQTTMGEAYALTNRQKENLIKFTSDTAIVVLFSIMIHGLMDDEDDIFHSGIGRKFGDVLLNSLGDLNMMKATDQMISAHPLAVLASLSRVIKNTSNAIVTVGEDPALAGKYLLKNIGAARIFLNEGDFRKKKKKEDSE